MNYCYIFFIFFLSFNAICVQNSNIVNDLRECEMGQKIDCLKVFGKTQAGKDLLKKCEFDSNDLYPKPRSDNNLILDGGVVYCVRKHFFSLDINSIEMDFLIEKLKKSFGDESLNFLCSEVIRHALNIRMYERHTKKKMLNFSNIFPILDRLLRIPNFNINYISGWGCGGDYQMSPLHILSACYGDQVAPEIIKFLLDRGADKKIKDTDNRTPCMRFIQIWPDENYFYANPEEHRVIIDLLKQDDE